MVHYFSPTKIPAIYLQFPAPNGGLCYVDTAKGEKKTSVPDDLKTKQTILTDHLFLPSSVQNFRICTVIIFLLQR